MIHYRFIIFILGGFLSILALAMTIPAAMDLLYHDPNWVYFGEGALITGFVGVLLMLSFKPEGDPSFEVRETFIFTVASWVVVSLFASLPFILSSAAPTFTDAFFEAISGLTTTGATVLDNLQYAPPGILLWRALLEWLGGIGIVVWFAGMRLSSRMWRLTVSPLTEPSLGVRLHLRFQADFRQLIRMGLEVSPVNHLNSTGLSI